MARTWILRTDTKGTGAEMVPLESVTARPSTPDPIYVPRKPAVAAPEPAPEPRPHRFRIVDVMTRRTLADDAGVREAVDVLRDVRATVDVNVYTWQEERGRWRPLTFAERRALWELAHQ